MAKKNEARVDVKVSDNGTLEKVSKSSKKAEKGLDGVAKASRTADRNLKGAAKASSNSTKNFSKMAQGSGGLVAAYATLAANIFAISAAFNFLKKAGDMNALIQSQEAFAQRTGVSMTLATARIQEATGGILAYEEASQALAVGTAAGLSTDQLEQLATVAKNASVALGRDLTDSFNRLTKGAVKAEPELLDELGIILRLDKATKDYGTQIGKAAKDLTTFERTQAVVNAVLEQGNQKFEDVGQNVNQIARLGKAFDDLVKKVQKAIEPIASFIGKTFANNIEALGAAFLLLGINITKALTPVAPALTDISAAAKQATKNLGSVAGTSVLGKNIASGDIGGREIAAIERAANSSSSKVINLSKTTKAALLRDIKIIKAQHQLAMAENTTGFAKYAAASRAELYALQAQHGVVMGTMRAGVAQFARFASRAMNAIAILGIITLAISLAKELIDLLKSDELLAIEARAGTLEESFKRQNVEMMGLVKTLEEAGSPMARLVQQAGLLSNISLMNLTNFKVPDVKVLRETPVYTPRTGTRTGTKYEIENVSGINLMVDAAKEGFTSLQLLQTQLKSMGIETKEVNQQMNALGAMFADIKSEGSLTGENWKTYTSIIENLNKQLPAAARNLQLLLGVPAAEAAALKGLANVGETFERFVNKRGQKDSKFSEYLGILEQGVQALETFQSKAEKLGKDKPLRDFFAIEDGGVEAEFGQLLALIGETTSSTLTASQVLAKFEGRRKQILEDEYNIRLATVNLQTKAVKQNRGLTKLQKDRNARLVKVLEIQNSINAINSDLKFQTNLGIHMDNTKVKSLRAQLDLLLAQKDAAEDLTNDVERIASSLRDTFASETSIGLADLLKNEESSFKDAVAKMAENTLKAAADTTAKIITEGLMDKIFKKAGPAAKIKSAMLSAGEWVAALWDKIIRGAGSAAGTIKTAGSNVKEKGISVADSFKDLGKNLMGAPSPTETRAAPSTSKIGTNGEGMSESGVIGKRGGSGLKKLFGDFTEDMGSLFGSNSGFFKEFEGLFRHFGKNLGSIFDTLLGDLGGIFKSIFGGGGSDGGGLLGSIIGIGVSAFAGAGAGAGAGTATNSFMGTLDTSSITTAAYGRNGGVMNPPPGLSTGGIVRGSTSGYPATLHGTEAVVPLPDGKSIPVSMEGGGQQNNVSVNVNIDGNGNAQQQQQGDGPGMNLGAAIARAVQQELQNQKRSGGILNPYGVA